MLFKTNYFCSPVQGQILYEGEPLSGIKVVRTLKADGLEGGEYQDSAVTNEQGFFEFPEVSNKTFLVRPQILSANPGVSQNIAATYLDERYVLWTKRRQSFEPGVETSIGRIQMVCELTNSDKSERFKYYSVKSDSLQASRVARINMFGL